tara:strand:+ start:340 stop:603 length:264 start_codon:yes stop_codon:yes gene_type:complete
MGWKHNTSKQRLDFAEKFVKADGLPSQRLWHAMSMDEKWVHLHGLNKTQRMQFRRHNSKKPLQHVTVDPYNNLKIHCTFFAHPATGN